MAESIRPTLLASLRERVAMIRTALSPIHCELRWLGQHCERVAFHSARDGVATTLRLTVQRDADGRVSGQWLGDEPLDTKYTARLIAMLGWLGVDQVEFDTRLEAAQIYEAFAIVRSIALASVRFGGRLERKGRAASLRSAEGLHVGCTNVRLDEGQRRLTIEYSYCQTVFSWAVKLVKRQNRAFRDHRAFFSAAPKYAICTLVVGFLPLVLPALGVGVSGLVAAGAVAALLVAGAVYLFFLAIGSAEYDNEVQADRLRKAYGQIKAYSDRVKADLRRAREHQRRMLPAANWRPAARNIAIAATFEPQGEVGGDYYDFRELSDGRIAILLADVSGHGLAAALVTGVIKTIFEQSDELLSEVGDFLLELNRRLLRIIPDDAFAAAFYGILDPRTGKLTYCNAGHNPPGMWVGRNGSADKTIVRELMGGHGPLVGALEDWSCTVETVQFRPADRLLLVTDGVVDILGPNGDRFGLPRVLELATGAPDRSVAVVCEDLMKAAVAFGAGTPQPDDQTVVMLEYRGA